MSYDLKTSIPLEALPCSKYNLLCIVMFIFVATAFRKGDVLFYILTDTIAIRAGDFVSSALFNAFLNDENSQ